MKSTRKKRPPKPQKKSLSGVSDIAKRIEKFDLEKTGKSALYLGIGAVLLGGLVYGLYWFASTKIQALQTANAEEDVFDTLQPESFARRLRLAFYDGSQFMNYGGTDEEAIIQVFDEMPTQAFYARVVSAYSNLYDGESLTADLEDELKDSPETYDQIQTKMSSKPR